MIELPTHAPPQPPRYGRWAFFNAYNLGLFGGAVAAAALTQNWFMALAAAGLEALWMLVGPDAHAFKRWVDRRHREEWAEEAKKRLEAIVKALPESERVRVEQLEAMRADVLRMAKNNPSFAGALLELEFGKLDQLRDGFVVLAHSCVRAEEHLAQVDPRDLERQAEAQRRIAKSDADEPARRIAERNIQVLSKRMAAVDDVKKFLGRARGQMTLIENTISLMRDQVVTMRAPEELAEPLDDLLQGMDAVRAAANEGDELAALTPVTEVAAGEADRGGPTKVSVG